jgi:hypothetical protein
MPYQVKQGSLVIVVTNSAEALRLFDSMTTHSDEAVLIRDMDGREIDLDVIRTIAGYERK